MLARTLPAQTQDLFHYLFEQASLGIAVEDLDGTLLLANPALCSMLGYAENELCGMNCSQFANPEDSEDDWALFQQLSAGVIDRYSLEKRYVRKDGAQLWGRLNVSLLKNDNGGSPLVFAFLEDVTERRQTEDALRESEQSFLNLFENAPLPKWLQAIEAITPVKSAGLGVVLSAVNPKNLLLIVGGGLAIAGAPTTAGGKTVAAVVFVVLAVSSVVVPVVLYHALGARGERMLESLNQWLQANNATVMAVLLLVIGVVLVGKGLGGF